MRFLAPLLLAVALSQTVSAQHQAEITLPALDQVQTETADLRSRLDAISRDLQEILLRLAELDQRITALENSDPGEDDGDGDGDGDGDDDDGGGTGESPIDAADVAEWERQMVEHGLDNGPRLVSNHTRFTNAIQYDPDYVYARISEHTGDVRFMAFSDHAYRVNSSYILDRDKPGGVPSYNGHTYGLLRRARKGDQRAKAAIIALSQRASYSADWLPLSRTESEALSREVAYNMLFQLHAEELGEPHRTRLDDFAEQALGHLEQWQTGTVDNWAPFMAAISCHALARYHAKYPDPAIPPAIERMAQYMWENAYVADDKAMWYRATNQTKGSPDLNGLVIWPYAWLYRQTGDASHARRAALLLQGLNDGAYLRGLKQFNQSYWWTFDALEMLGAIQ